MARVPVITSPCPVRFKSAPQSGKDFCGQCQRRVHDLDGMNDAQRAVFFASCSGEVCVSFSVKRAVTAVAASVLVGGAVFAAEPIVNPPEIINTPSPACPVESEYIIMGGTKAGKDLQWIDASEAKVPDSAELPEISDAEWLPTPDKG
jgi:hypothetical protein